MTTSDRVSVAIAYTYTELSRAETAITLCLSGEGDRHQLDQHLVLENALTTLERVMDRLYPLLPPFIEGK